MDYEWLQFVMLAFIRAGGLLSMAPLFSGRNLPARLRVCIALFLAYTASSLPHESVPVTGSVATLILCAGHELLLGLLMGLGVRLVFHAVEMTGQLISTEMGLVMSSQIDPISQNNTTSIGTALFFFATLLFILSDAHHGMIAAFIRSFTLAPPGVLAPSLGAGDFFVRTSGNIFLLAVQMAAPLMAINFIVSMTFVVLGKAAPSINVFSESAPVRILAGLTLLGLTLGLTAQLVLSQIRDSPELMLRLLP
jgi:flagellar biosynthetic protein FliR